MAYVNIARITSLASKYCIYRFLNTLFYGISDVLDSSSEIYEQLIYTIFWVFYIVIYRILASHFTTMIFVGIIKAKTTEGSGVNKRFCNTKLLVGIEPT